MCVCFVMMRWMITVAEIISSSDGGGGKPFLTSEFFYLKYLNNSNIFVIFVLSKCQITTI